MSPAIRLAGPLAAPGLEGAPSAGWAYRQQAVNVVLIGIMALPAIAGIGGGAVRLTFPILAVLIAGYMLAKGRLSQYVTFCIWLFLVTPCIRRMVDFRVGWEALNLLMLAPYAAALLSLGTFAHLFVRARDVIGRAAFVTLAAAITYGLANAVVQGKMFAGGYDYLRWAIPPAFALLIVFNQDHLSEISRELMRLMIVSVPLVGGYGIYQFMYLPGWDAFWMQGSGLLSIGLPVPFQVRVFSTMNSPGSFAGFLMTALTFLLVSRSPLRWIGLGAGCLTLALSLSRTAWLGFALAGVILVLVAPIRTRISVITFATAAFFSLPLLLAVPEIYNTIEKRLDSFNYLSSDTSFNERSTDYQIFQNEASTLLLGQGLAVNGAYTSYAESGPVRYIDGGPIETVTALGLIAGLLYYGSIALLTANALAVRARDPDEAALCAACKATVAVGWVLQIGGSSTIGEVGLFFWIAIGVLLAQTARRAKPAAAQVSRDPARRRPDPASTRPVAPARRHVRRLVEEQQESRSISGSTGAPR